MPISKKNGAGISKNSKAIKKSKKEEGVVNFDDSDEDDDSEAEIKKHRKPLTNIYKEKRRGFTISIVVPSSIIDNA